MKRLALGVLLASVAASAPSSARAGRLDTTPPLGQKCAFNSTTDVTRPPGWQIGYYRAGPLVAGGVLRCRIVVNSNAHSSPNIRAELKVDSTAGAVIFGAGTFSYQATAADDVTMCSAWDPDGTFGDADTRYWVGGDVMQLQLGHWSSDPNDACGVPLTIDTSGSPECGLFLWADEGFGTNLGQLWEDCSPYEPLPLPHPLG